MLGKKKRRPVLEVSLNLIPLLEGLGLDKTLDQTMKAVQEGKTDIIEKIATRIQQGKLELSVNVGRKKKRVPISFVVRLKKD